MRKLLYGSLTLLSLFLFCCSGFAQMVSDTTTTKTSSFNQAMRSDNKIYVVMTICLTILAGLILYIVRIDRKLTKLEKHDTN